MSVLGENDWGPVLEPVKQVCLPASWGPKRLTFDFQVLPVSCLLKQPATFAGFCYTCSAKEGPSEKSNAFPPPPQPQHPMVAVGSGQNRWAQPRIGLLKAFVSRGGLGGGGRRRRSGRRRVDSRTPFPATACKIQTCIVLGC